MTEAKCFIIFLSVSLSLLSLSASSTDNYQYFCTGNCDTNVQGDTRPGLVVMGGGTDVDAAFEWMIERAGGGDFLVLRTTGTDAYDPYIYGMGGVNSVSTLILGDRNASYNDFVIQKIMEADALFFAGGDQWTYYSYWKDTPVEDSVMQLKQKGIPMGGTSAGTAILGQFVYTAEFDSVLSSEALSDPYYYRVTIGTDFLSLNYMNNLVTDTHFDTRDRMGRFIVFVARLMRDVWSSPQAWGIAVDEETALLIDGDGTVSSTSWTKTGSAYILSPQSPPQTCEPGKSLTWNDINVFRLSGNTTNAYSLVTHTPYNVPGTLSYQLSVNRGKITSTQSGGDIY